MSFLVLRTYLKLIYFDFYLHLVLEGSALPAAVGRNSMFAERLWNTRTNDDRRSADAFQGSCLGGSGWPRG